MWDVKRSPYQAKQSNDSVFIEDLIIMWGQYDMTLVNSDNMFVSLLSLDNRYNQTCLMWPFKGTVKYGHIRQVVV